MSMDLDNYVTKVYNKTISELLATARPMSSLIFVKLLHIVQIALFRLRFSFNWQVL